MSLKAPIDLLTVEEVAELLKVSTDTVTRQFERREGVIDLGTPETMHKRRRRMLRIPRATLDRYLEEKTVRRRRR